MQGKVIVKTLPSVHWKCFWFSLSDRKWSGQRHIDGRHKPRVSPEEWNPFVSLEHGEFMYSSFLLISYSFFLFLLLKNTKQEYSPQCSAIMYVDTFKLFLTLGSKLIQLYPMLEFPFISFCCLNIRKYVWTWIHFTSTLLILQKYLRSKQAPMVQGLS